MRKFSKEEIKAANELWNKGWAYNEIARALRTRRKTVRTMLDKEHRNQYHEYTRKE